MMILEFVGGFPDYLQIIASHGSFSAFDSIQLRYQHVTSVRIYFAYYAVSIYMTYSKLISLSQIVKKYFPLSRNMTKK